MIYLIELITRIIQKNMRMLVKLFNFFVLRSQELYWFIKATPKNIFAWICDKYNRNFYKNLTFQQTCDARRSDTVFICGTGYSILDITPNQWDRMNQHDILSFRDFPRQTFIDVDFHVTGEVDNIDEYVSYLINNPLYDDTVFLVQEGLLAVQGNIIIGRKKLNPSRKVCRYKRASRGVMSTYSRSFADGIVHGNGSVVGMVNLAYLMGWKNIILVGIDMYDHRYFFQSPDQTRPVEKQGLTYKDPFPQGINIASHLGMWRDEMLLEGVYLSVFNPKSLLAERLPVFDFSSLK
tara:strand:+ start:77 stop:955 length:879 start_codon:yes stop_codon:yes gene_type:complete